MNGQGGREKEVAKENNAFIREPENNREHVAACSYIVEFAKCDPAKAEEIRFVLKSLDYLKYLPLDLALPKLIHSPSKALPALQELSLLNKCQNWSPEQDLIVCFTEKLLWLSLSWAGSKPSAEDSQKLFSKTRLVWAPFQVPGSKRWGFLVALPKTGQCWGYCYQCCEDDEEHILVLAEKLQQMIIVADGCVQKIELSFDPGSSGLAVLYIASFIANEWKGEDPMKWNVRKELPECLSDIDKKKEVAVELMQKILLTLINPNWAHNSFASAISWVERCRPPIEESSKHAATEEAESNDKNAATDADSSIAEASASNVASVAPSSIPSLSISCFGELPDIESPVVPKPLMFYDVCEQDAIAEPLLNEQEMNVPPPPPPFPSVDDCASERVSEAGSTRSAAIVETHLGTASLVTELPKLKKMDVVRILPDTAKFQILVVNSDGSCLVVSKGGNLNTVNLEQCKEAPDPPKYFLCYSLEAGTLVRFFGDRLGTVLKRHLDANEVGYTLKDCLGEENVFVFAKDIVVVKTEADVKEAKKDYQLNYVRSNFENADNVLKKACEWKKSHTKVEMEEDMSKVIKNMEKQTMQGVLPSEVSSVIMSYKNMENRAYWTLSVFAFFLKVDITKRKRGQDDRAVRTSFIEKWESCGLKNLLSDECDDSQVANDDDLLANVSSWKSGSTAWKFWDVGELAKKFPSITSLPFKLFRDDKKQVSFLLTNLKCWEPDPVVVEEQEQDDQELYAKLAIVPDGLTKVVQILEDAGERPSGGEKEGDEIDLDLSVLSALTRQKISNFVNSLPYEREAFERTIMSVKSGLAEASLRKRAGDDSDLDLESEFAESSKKSKTSNEEEEEGNDEEEKEEQGKNGKESPAMRQRQKKK